MIYASRTDVGKQRELNEDACGAFYSLDSECDFFIVADGMGGHNCGEVASKMAIENITKYLIEEPLDAPEKFDSILVDSVKAANDLICFKANENEQFSGMGTTVAMVAVKDDIAHICHAGDSRVYLYRDDELTQITVDHSYISELMKIGYLTEEEAAVHPKRNVITQALGSEEGVSPDINLLKLKKDDYLLICTDGFYNMVSDNETVGIIKAFVKPEEICDVLIERANENGGEDNATIIVVKI